MWAIRERPRAGRSNKRNEEKQASPGDVKPASTTGKTGAVTKVGELDEFSSAVEGRRRRERARTREEETTVKRGIVVDRHRLRCTTVRSPWARFRQGHVPVRYLGDPALSLLSSSSRGAGHRRDSGEVAEGEARAEKSPRGAPPVPVCPRRRSNHPRFWCIVVYLYSTKYYLSLTIPVFPEALFGYLTRCYQKIVPKYHSKQPLALSTVASLEFFPFLTARRSALRKR